MVYKWTDSDGVVHFSDQPVPGAEKIVTSSSTSNGIGGGARVGNTPSQPIKSSPLGLSELSIISPAKEQVFFNDDVVPIRLTIEPGLQENQTITWHMNGKELDDKGPRTTSFTLQSLPRGTYVIAATITDSATGESKTSDSVTFYMRQPSELDNQHRVH